MWVSLRKLPVCSHETGKTIFTLTCGNDIGYFRILRPTKRQESKPWKLA